MQQQADDKEASQPKENPIAAAVFDVMDGVASLLLGGASAVAVFGLMLNAAGYGYAIKRCDDIWRPRVEIDTLEVLRSRGQGMRVREVGKILLFPEEERPAPERGQQRSCSSPSW